MPIDDDGLTPDAWEGSHEKIAKELGVLPDDTVDLPDAVAKQNPYRDVVPYTHEDAWDEGARLGLAHGKREGEVKGRAEALNKWFGEKCSDFEPSCDLCKAWAWTEELAKAQG